MTEQQAIRVFKEELEIIEPTNPQAKELCNSMELSIKALGEVQQYRALGTVEECKVARNVKMEVTTIVDRLLVTNCLENENLIEAFWEIADIIQENY